MARPKKRKRDSQEPGNSAERSTNPPPKHSNCLYFKDGNIVLIAQDTAFRVHKSVLALHSDVFRNMFGDVNQPVDAEVFDGCSVVRLSDESEALETFLKALYTIESATRNLDRGRRILTSDVSRPISHPKEPSLYFPPVLRLATKYLCNAIRRQALDAFRCRYYPDTLPSWDTRDDLLDPEDTIRLARDIKAEILLPGAFYRLCLRSFPVEEMYQDDAVTYFVGKAKLAAFWPQFLENQLVRCKNSPCNHFHCMEGWRTFLEKKTLITLKEFQDPYADPLAQFKDCSQDIDKADGVCLETRKTIKKSCDEKRMEIWNKLPEIFGLESWAKLRDADDGSYDDHFKS